MPNYASANADPGEPDFCLPRDGLDRRLAALLAPPALPAGFRQDLWRAIAAASAQDLEQRRRALELERARQLSLLERDYVRMRRDTLAMVLAAALTAGAGLDVALPWLAGQLNTSVATLTPWALLALALSAAAWIWRGPLLTLAWRWVD